MLTMCVQYYIPNYIHTAVGECDEVTLHSVPLGGKYSPRVRGYPGR